MEDNQTILVPWDFTQVAEHALEVAISVSNRVSNDIALIHIVKKDTEIEEAKVKLNDVVEKILKERKIRTIPIVKEGTIFTTIGETAEELNANLVVMGTHGIKGMQKFLGSWALKVIVSSKVPFIIVQDLPDNQNFEKIVLPINFKQETKENVAWVHYLSRFYKTKFHVLKANHSDTRFSKGVESNMYFLTKFFESKNIDYELAESPGKKDFAKEVIDFAAQIEADLILIMTTKGIGLADYVLGAHEQYIIANSAKIPVMCINPRPPRNVGGFRAGGG